MRIFMLLAMALAICGVVISASLLAATPRMSSPAVSIDPMQLTAIAGDMPVAEVAEPF